MISPEYHKAEKNRFSPRRRLVLQALALGTPLIDCLRNAPTVHAQEPPITPTGVEIQYLPVVESAARLERLPFIEDIRALLQTLGIQLPNGIQAEVPLTCENMSLEDVAARLRRGLQIIVDDTRSDVNGQIVFFQRIVSCVIRSSAERGDGAVTKIDSEPNNGVSLEVIFGEQSWGSAVANELFHMIVDAYQITEAPKHLTRMLQMIYFELLSLLLSWDVTRRARFEPYGYEPTQGELDSLARKTLETIGFTLTSSRENSVHITEHLQTFLDVFGDDAAPLIEFANITAFGIARDVVLSTGNPLTKQILSIVECLALNIPYSHRTPLHNSPIVEALDKAIREKRLAETSNETYSTTQLYETAFAGWTLWENEGDALSILIKNISFEFSSDTQINTCNPSGFEQAYVTDKAGNRHNLEHTDLEIVNRVGSPFMDFRITNANILTAMQEGGKIYLQFTVSRSDNTETQVIHRIELQPNYLDSSQNRPTQDLIQEISPEIVTQNLETDLRAAHRQRLENDRVSGAQVYTWDDITQNPLPTKTYQLPTSA